MKLLVGILFCIENELNDCLNSIKNQDHKDFEYFIIKNKPKKVAHQILYSNFMNKASEFDLFVKLDADMVLVRNSFFSELIERIKEEPDIDDLCIPVYDFFTQKNIWGLHIYSNRVKWDLDVNEEVFTDRIEITDKKVFEETGKLVPAAHHCPNPSLFQAYHFGIHKGVKVTQINRSEKNKNAAINRLIDIERTISNFHRSNDQRLGLAALGGLIAINKNFTFREVDFDSSKSKEQFEQIKKLNTSQLKKVINREKRKALFYLPRGIRLETLLFYKTPKYYYPTILLPYLGKVAKSLTIKIFSK